MERGASGERRRISSLVLKWSEREVDRVPSSSVEDRNEWSYTSADPMCLPGQLLPGIAPTLRFLWFQECVASFATTCCHKLFAHRSTAGANSSVFRK